MRDRARDAVMEREREKDDFPLPQRIIYPASLNLVWLDLVYNTFICTYKGKEGICPKQKPQIFVQAKSATLAP